MISACDQLSEAGVSVEIGTEQGAAGLYRGMHAKCVRAVVTHPGDPVFHRCVEFVQFVFWHQKLRDPRYAGSIKNEPYVIPTLAEFLNRFQGIDDPRETLMRVGARKNYNCNLCVCHRARPPKLLMKRSMQNTPSVVLRN